jgi:hypothetical protein
MVKAAPTILSLAERHGAAGIQRTFDEFFVWGLYLRGNFLRSFGHSPTCNGAE